MITLYHAPRTRSSGVLALLEELGAPYDLQALNLSVGAPRPEAFLAVNPLGKVPAVVDDGVVVTEQVAIMLHLADRFPAAGLAPALGDPQRGRYLRWMVFYAAAFEPAVVDKARGHEPGHRPMSPYGSYQAVLDAVLVMLTPGPWVLGETFSAADVLWGTALGWTMKFNLVPPNETMTAYADRVAARPGMLRAVAKDAALAG